MTQAEFHARIRIHFDRTLAKIKKDFPQASMEYKQSSFAVGAKELAMSFVQTLPLKERIEFAKSIDNIFQSHFPTK